MDNAIMIGLSRQMTLRRSMDVVANNIANANTAGFKVETLLLENHVAPTARHSDGPQDLQFVNAWGMGRDFSQGTLERTGRPFDIAIEGDGFFGVETANGTEYTRDGRFHVDDQGQFVTTDGAPVIDADTRLPIFVTPGAENYQIVDGGTVMEDGVAIGRIGVFEMPDRGALTKQGNGRYTYEPADLNAPEPEAVFDPAISQGYIESSNVQSVVEITNMMTVMRAYESVSKYMKEAEDLNRKAIERLGKV